MKIAKDAIVIGNVPDNVEVGEGGIRIGATDARGNTILNTPMTIGRNAQGGPNSVVIGAGANGGSTVNLAEVLYQLAEIARANNQHELLNNINATIVESQKLQPNKSRLETSWDAIKAASTIDGVFSLVERIAPIMAVLISNAN